MTECYAGKILETLLSVYGNKGVRAISIHVFQRSQRFKCGIKSRWCLINMLSSHWFSASESASLRWGRIPARAALPARQKYSRAPPARTNTATHFIFGRHSLFAQTFLDLITFVIAETVKLHIFLVHLNQLRNYYFIREICWDWSLTKSV